MANIITSLRHRMHEDRGTNKTLPTKVYKTAAAAEKALAKEADILWKALDRNSTPADYLVFEMPEWGGWTGAINMRELMTRHSFIGGFVGSNFYQF